MVRHGAATIGAVAGLLLLLQIGQASVAEEPRYRTTHPDIALRNLDHQIEQARRILRVRPHDPDGVSNLLDHLLNRVQFRGSYSDFDAALAITEGLLSALPNDPGAGLARARILERLHHFDEAIDLLDDIRARIEQPPISVPSRAWLQSIEQARIRITLARGRPEAVIASLRQLAAERPGFGTHTQLAFGLEALGRIDEAERSYVAALAFWDQITPFPVAWVEFQRGELYVGRDDARAAAHYRRALDYLPLYVTPRVHLAELLAEDDDLDGAIALLEAVAGRSEDPEVNSRLAEFLMAAGRDEEAMAVRSRAEQGYADLAERHPLAFLDHIAEFWLGAGNDPAQAWINAERHLANGASDRALGLAIEAAAAASRPELCDLIEQASSRRGRHPGLDDQLDLHSPHC